MSSPDSSFKVFLEEELKKLHLRIIAEYTREKDALLELSCSMGSGQGKDGRLRVPRDTWSDMDRPSLSDLDRPSYNTSEAEELQEAPSQTFDSIPSLNGSVVAPFVPEFDQSRQGFSGVLPNEVPCDTSSVERPSRNTNVSKFSSNGSGKSKARERWRTGATGVSLCSRRSLLRRTNTGAASSTSKKSSKAGMLNGPLFDEDFEVHEAWLGEGDEEVDDKVQQYKSGLLMPRLSRSSRLGMQKKTSTYGELFRLKGGSSSASTLMLGMGMNHGWWQSLVSDPSSTRRLWWGIIGVALIAYDVITIPLAVFDIPENIWTTVLQMIFLCFWICDVPASFFVGYHANGVLEMHLKAIAMRYLKTYFCMDVILVIVDLVAITLSLANTDESETAEPTGIARVAKSWRLLRILRSFRLIRLLKLPRTFAHLMERVQSDSLVIILGIVRLTFGILVLNHYVACLWYGVGSWSASSQNWVTHFSVSDRSTIDLYATCLHWSLTQFTPASMEIHPVSLAERTFTIVVIIFALVTFSSFVSSITNAMTSLRNMNQEQAKSFALLQRFLLNNDISVSLCIRIRRHIEFKVRMHQQSVQERDVAFLQMLTTPLRIDLHYEVHRTRFKHHTFFVRYDLNFNRCMKKMCFEAVESLHVSDHDVFFTRGDEAKQFFGVKQGVVMYRDFKDENQEVCEDEWLAEPVLWTRWVHHGRAKAQGECVLLTLDAAKFQNCAQENLAALRGPSHYATLFVEHLNTLNFEELTDLRDESFDVEWASDLAFTERLNMSSSTVDDCESPQKSPNNADQLLK